MIIKRHNDLDIVIEYLTKKMKLELVENTKGSVANSHVFIYEEAISFLETINNCDEFEVKK